MKNYLMLFIFLFSSLSFQWAGAGALNLNSTTSEHAGSQVVNPEHAQMHNAVVMNKAQHDNQQSHESHDCCPSMQSSSNEVLESCVHCGDGCQCASGQICQHTSPVVNSNDPSMPTGQMISALTPPYTPLLVFVAISPELKPPQA